MKNHISKSIIIFTVLLILGGCYGYTLMTVGIPFRSPTTVIKYNDKSVPTSLGDHNWIPKNGGDSYETGGEYAVGKSTSEFIAKSGDTVNILIPSKPITVRIDQILDNNYKHKEYKVVTNGNEYIFPLPIEKGEYIFKVFAMWDADKHNTATIFRVKVE